MLRVRWDAIEAPGDDSSYVQSLRRLLVAEAAPRLGAALDGSQFGFFCDKLGRMFVPRFLESVYKLRRLSEKGTLQLSIDAEGVRRLLLELPKAARPLDGETVAAPYTHYVEREMGVAVSLIKVLQVRRCLPSLRLPCHLQPQLLLCSSAARTANVAHHPHLLPLPAYDVIYTRTHMPLHAPRRSLKTWWIPLFC
jgi:hypothetical protein